MEPLRLVIVTSGPPPPTGPFTLRFDVIPATATPARSVPVEVAVGNPPTDSNDSLSKTTCVRFPGR